MYKTLVWPGECTIDSPKCIALVTRTRVLLIKGETGVS